MNKKKTEITKTSIKYTLALVLTAICFGGLLLANQQGISIKHQDEDQAKEISLITLNDGQQLSYMEYGKKEGIPVFYFHGFPGSHLDVKLFTNDDELLKNNIRLIAVDRPGYCESNAIDNRSLIDWALSMENFADLLDLEKFSIMAYSGGAPFAYACAHQMPDRLNEVVIVSGMTPANAPEAKKGAAMMIPKAPKLILKGMMKMLQSKPEKLEANMRKGFPEVDQLVYDVPEVKAVMMGTIDLGLRNGYLGAYQDAVIYKNYWDFDLSDIELPIRLYHGEQDLNVKIESALYVIDKLPNCISKVYPDEGHLSLIYIHAHEIMRTLSNE